MKTTIKQLFTVIGIVAFGWMVSSCDEGVGQKVSYAVTLDSSNTYLVGDPVVFNIEGDVDNILFYSGEQGHQYIYKDRFSVTVDDVNSAKLSLDYQARYGLADGLEVWVSKDFDGLKGNDAAADKATMKSLSDAGMPGWEKLDYQEGESTKWTYQDYDMSGYLEKFCVAFHWKPVIDGKSAQRTYWINGRVSLDLKGTAPSSMDIRSLSFTTVMMNDEIADPYTKNAGNGSIVLNNAANALVFQGVGATALSYALDGWAVSTPVPLNKVSRDNGIVIKNLQNYLQRYEYTFTEPGTYTVTFVGVNENYDVSSRQVREMKVTILDRI